jgi:hypothetical protein
VLREALREQGRRRVTENYTQAAIAQQTVDVYRQILGQTATQPITILNKMIRQRG